MLYLQALFSQQYQKLDNKIIAFPNTSKTFRILLFNNFTIKEVT